MPRSRSAAESLGSKREWNIRLDMASSRNPNRTPTDMQRQVMAMLDKHGELTTSQIRSRLGTNKAITENVMRGMHSKRLAVSEKRQVQGITHSFWSLVK